MNQLIKRVFETKIGMVECELLSNYTTIAVIGKEQYENGIALKYQTIGHQIEVIEFKARTHELVKDSKGWIFRITKNRAEKEQLKIKCALKHTSKDVEFSPASGAYLDAIEGYNQEWQLHIGTEDEDMILSRARQNDWFPKRLEGKLTNFYRTFTTYLKENNGLQTSIPILENNEKIHIQYLSAIDDRNDENINCWNAVDENKSVLENWIGV